jgi:hypothetical protein
MPRLTFRDEDGTESEVQFEQPPTLTRGHLESVLNGTGVELAPFLELIGCKVLEAEAEQQGTLRLRFSNGMALTLIPCGYEGWHFRGKGLTLNGLPGSLA